MSHRQWRYSKFGALAIKLPLKTNSVDICGVFVGSVKLFVVLAIEISHNTAGDGYSHAQHIDGNKETIFPKIAQGNPKVVFDHEMVRKGGWCCQDSEKAGKVAPTQKKIERNAALTGAAFLSAHYT
jgi:hypothetical protein